MTTMLGLSSLVHFSYSHSHSIVSSNSHTLHCRKLKADSNFPFYVINPYCKVLFPFDCLAMDEVANGEEPVSWDELCNINLIPSELFLKFRKEIQGVRVGLNFEFYNAPMNEYQAKLVLKPLSPDRRWKFIYEPVHHDVHILSKKIPITNFLNLQVGVGHSFQLHTTGWKWKVTTCLGGNGLSRIRNKTSLGLFPGLDFRFGWRADYVLPEITGQVSSSSLSNCSFGLAHGWNLELSRAVGTGEPLFNMNSGRLQASLDRVEAILTHAS